jgi:hypothetical protein
MNIKKGMKLAVMAHVLGTVIAVAFGWFIPVWLPLFDDVRPAQFTFATVASAWGIWKLYEMLTGRDKLANDTSKHFEQKK